MKKNAFLILITCFRTLVPKDSSQPQGRAPLTAHDPADQSPLTGALINPATDPEPVRVINAETPSPLLLVCEHAGRKVPQSLDNLGLSLAAFETHIACDLGASEVAQGLAARFSCRLVMQNYSRLTIDCNRRPGEPSSIPEVSDGVVIPANQGLDGAQKKRREEEIFRPYATRCKAETERACTEFAYSIHSFTPQMRDGAPRPWDIAFLYRSPDSDGARLADLCAELWPDLVIGRNEPYFIDEKTDWFIPVCAEPRGVLHCLIEIRNDHLSDAAGRDLWTNRLYHLLDRFMEP
ncbi:MAG TPA: N-formylglutamate amidohydrolase [Rhodobacterales bacterium]|nr:N-formylglutamate amidohydrolase [Rhodobacterales bacterium]